MKKICIVLMIILCIVPTNIFAEEPYDGYIYQQGIGFTKEYPSTSTFEPQEVIRGEQLGTTSFKAPRDLMRFEDKLYVLDSGNGRIVVIDEDNQMVEVIDQFTFEGKEETLNDPYGLMVTKESIYVADTENERILQMNHQGEIQQMYTRPDSVLINQTIPFAPQKVVVDSVGNVYTNIKGGFKGLVEFNQQGEFLGFFGGDKISNVFEIADLILWKNILTKEQQSRMKKIVPIEFSSILIDEKNFIYTVSLANDNKGVIRKLNWKEKDLFESMSGITAIGYGDLSPGSESPVFVDVCLDEDQILYCLDSTTGRIFQYDQQGNMLGVFGRYGSQKGTFFGPTALESFNDKIYVLDQQFNQITVFKKTEFGEIISQAITLFHDGRYEEAAKIWQLITEINPNFMFSYTGLGKAATLEGNYKQALDYFEIAANQMEYSDAFKLYRTEWIKNNFASIGIGTILLIVLIFTLLAMKKKKKFEKLKDYIKSHKNMEQILLPLKIMFHPIDGFEELKFKNKGYMPLALVLTVLLFIAFSMEWLYTGFAFTSNGPSTFKLTIVLMQSVGMLGIYVLSNYAICSLLDGKGKFSEVFIGTVYALLPTILAIFINIGLSQVLVVEEQFIMSIINSISLAWTLILIVNSLMILHQYTLKKTIGTILLTLIGILVILFLIALCIILYSQVATFVKSLTNEIILRMA